LRIPLFSRLTGNFNLFLKNWKVSFSAFRAACVNGK
jgi:hypothetical protein